ncbi:MULTISPECIES: class I SAM-dependent methyltransferase [Methylomonas]|uniref:class I SAM-dependent methyltransferase n=1 Tax=Methylomonas TaxID=416 RepID=UPI0007C94B3D|nr:MULTISPECIES: class I SAM-dependent methyltransferase [Methylomonas]ANE57415.1 methyltransferase type 11 [Methylomonas sp. DH-1]ATG92398.1 methyltransferase type 11 [Methylomonas koyamae]BBL60658.1 SAM-dependent methyltransferase [Methylomonas koyamae]
MAAADSEQIRRRYDRLAPWFDSLEGILEGLLFRRLRKKLWSQASGGHILEVGVGTGKNFAFYPDGARITGIDFSPKMLEQAQRKRQRKQIAVDLAQMDVQALDYADNSFDTVIASFVFCSVPKPRRGLKELYRVCKPGGQVLLLEHVLSSNRFMAFMMNLLNPLVVKTLGANINRETLKNVQACPFRNVYTDPASSDMIKLIRAIK